MFDPGSIAFLIVVVILAMLINRMHARVVKERREIREWKATNKEMERLHDSDKMEIERRHAQAIEAAANASYKLKQLEAFDLQGRIEGGQRMGNVEKGKAEKSRGK